MAQSRTEELPTRSKAEGPWVVEGIKEKKKVTFSLRLRPETALGRGLWGIETWLESLQLKKQARGPGCPESVTVSGDIGARCGADDIG